MRNLIILVLLFLVAVVIAGCSNGFTRRLMRQ